MNFKPQAGAARAVGRLLVAEGGIEAVPRQREVAEERVARENRAQLGARLPPELGQQRPASPE